MPVPSTAADLSTTAASNSPAGPDAIGTSLDDYLRSIQAIIKQQDSKGSDIASATTIDVPSSGKYFVVTGTTTIAGISDDWNGRVVVLKFSGILQLTHSASFILPTSANITTAAGDCLMAVNESTGVWRVVAYQRASGVALSGVPAGAITTSGLTQATSRMLGRTTASTGAIEELTLSQVLDLIGSAAQGDILYRDAAGWARLGAGTSGDFLKTQGAAANPIWATIAASGLSSKFVSATRDISLASGTQAITGAGFQPTACILLAAVTGTAFYSTGIADSATNEGSIDFASGTYNITLNLARVGAAGGRADAVVTSWDADGVTLTWTKVSSPTGTATLYFLFLK